jgi:hypothetical protein
MHGKMSEFQTIFRLCCENAFEINGLNAWHEACKARPRRIAL